MNRCRFIAAGVLAALAALGIPLAAQEYPSKPIHVITAEAGGGNDFSARLMAPALSAALGQPVVVDNRSGILGITAAAKAAPDGYTLLNYGDGMWTTPLLQKVQYDPVKDFAPIVLTMSSPSVLVVHPSLPVSSVHDLIALAKRRPAELNYASAMSGSSSHLAAEYLKALAGVDIVRVPYKGAGPALNGLISGQVHMGFASAASVMPHIKTGRLKALAVTGPAPSALVPGASTMAAALPGYEFMLIQGVFAPARTPDAIIIRLNLELVRILNRAEVRERIAGTGAESVGSSPDQFAAAIKSQMSKLDSIIRTANIRLD